MIRPHYWLPLALVVGLFSFGTGRAEAQLVPGTGTVLNYDDFEDEVELHVQLPKSSKEEDEQIRYPLGASDNRKWAESPKRGTPDQVQRIATPAGGITGSKGALLIAFSRHRRPRTADGASSARTTSS